MFEVFDGLNKVKGMFSAEKLKGEYAENAPSFMVKENLMKTDIIETNTQYTIESEIPGARKGSISIDYSDGILTIKVKAQKKIEEVEYIRKERVNRSYSRSFYIDNILIDDLVAKYKNGILTIVIPKEKVSLSEDSTSISIE